MAMKKSSSPKVTKIKGVTKYELSVPTPPELKIKLITYTVRATIPTMAYGNIMPEITVEARTMEDAKLAVFPHIEDLYETYCEEPREGRKPRFMSKASVTATEKIVPQPAKPTQPDVKSTHPLNPTGPTGPTPAPATELDAFADDLKKSPAYSKAEGAVKGAMSKDALGLIEDQIQKSTKLSEEEKPLLLTEVLKRRKEFN